MFEYGTWVNVFWILSYSRFFFHVLFIDYLVSVHSALSNEFIKSLAFSLLAGWYNLFETVRSYTTHHGFCLVLWFEKSYSPVATNWDDKFKFSECYLTPWDNFHPCTPFQMMGALIIFDCSSKFFFSFQIEMRPFGNEYLFTKKLLYFYGFGNPLILSQFWIFAKRILAIYRFWSSIP